MLIDANTNYEKDLILDRLFGWHHALFPKGYSGFAKISVASLRGEETIINYNQRRIKCKTKF